MNVAQTKIKEWRDHPDQFVREVFNVEPDEWQLKVLREFPHSNRIAMKAPLSLDTIIPTPGGEKKFGDIKRGDSVFAEDGSVTKVLKRFDVGRQKIYRVTFRDGTYVDACGEHEWKVQTGYDRKLGKYRTLSTKEILDSRLKSPSGQRQISIPVQGPAEYPAKELPLDSYVFGLWIGDGSRSEPSIICPDPVIRTEIESRGFETSLKKNKKTIRVSGHVKEFKQTGINDLYCYEKFIPDKYKTAGVDQRLDLLRGMMDADGTTASNGHTYYATSSLKLANDIIWLARSLGYLCTLMGPYKINDGENRDSYRAVITGPACPFLADTIKKRRWRKPKKFRYTRFIDSVKRLGKEDCMCIEVENSSHCFLVSSFIPTHNCKGPGKTCLLAWLIWNFLATRPHPNIAATSITSDNLSDGLWKELAKWQIRSEFLKAMFIWTKTRVVAREHVATWWCSARTFNKAADPTQQADTLAGLHADYMLAILDEAGGIPDSVMATVEAILATGIETKIIIAGNPTHTDGPLYRACTSEAHLWKVTEITGDPDDPMRSPRIDKVWARQQIEKYGRENPWVLVNVFGKFPPSSINTLLGPDEVRAAMKRKYRTDIYDWAQKRLGIDVSRYGDDRTVIFPRQGLQAFMPAVMRHNREDPVSVDIFNRVMMAKAKWRSEMDIFDDTVGWAHGAIDCMRAAGQSPLPIAFDRPSINPRYKNNRAYMWFMMAEWIKHGGSIPDIPELVSELTVPTYIFTGGKFQLEEKRQIKERMGWSPDLADALCLTFAIPDVPKEELILMR